MKQILCVDHKTVAGNKRNILRDQAHEMHVNIIEVFAKSWSLLRAADKATCQGPLSLYRLYYVRDKGRRAHIYTAVTIAVPLCDLLRAEGVAACMVIREKIMIIIILTKIINKHQR